MQQATVFLCEEEKKEKKICRKNGKAEMSVISVFKGEVRLTDERHTIGTNKKLVV